MAKKALNVVVLAGGISHEREVSLRSGRRVADALTAQGHRVVIKDPDAALLPDLMANRPDVIWPALHGEGGEDGALRSLLSTTGIPYVGSDGDSSRLAWFKPTAKSLASRAGIATPRSITLPQDAFRELGARGVLERVDSWLPSPVVVKPAEGGSAQGVSIVTHAEHLPRAMVEAYTYCDVAVIESLIVGTEISVGILDLGSGPVALPPIEIEPRSGVYSFDARYNAGETRFYAPARLSDAVTAHAADVALDVHRALGLRHISRVDLMIDAAGQPWFLEVNVMPGLTETSLLPQAIEAAGMTCGQVYTDLAIWAIDEAAGSDSDSDSVPAALI